MNAEDVIYSKITFKILKALDKFGQLNVTSLADDVGTGYVETYKRLQILKEEDVVSERRFGRIRMFRLNEQSSRVKAIRSLLVEWEQTKNP